MNNSTDNFFVYQSIAHLTLIIFGLTATYYLWRVQNKSIPTQLMLGFFGALTVAFTGLITRIDDIYSDPIIVTGILVATGLLAQFAYYFPQNDQPTESRSILIFSIIIFVTTIGLGLFHNYLFAIDGSPDLIALSINLMFLSIPIHLLVTMAVFIRRLLYLTAPHAGGSWQRHAYLMSVAPPDRATRMMRNFIFVILLGFVPGLSENLVRIGWMTVLVSIYLTNFGILITTFAFFLTYLNHAPERVSFTVKLVSVSLFVLLTIFSLVGVIITDRLQLQFETYRQSDVIQVYQALANDDIDFLPINISYIIQLSPDTGYEVLFSRIPDFTAASFVTENELRLTNPISFITSMPASNQFEQVIDTELTSFRRLVNPLDVYRAQFIAYTFEQNNQQYEVGFSVYPYDRAIHEATVDLMYLTIGSSLFILFVFPYFFHIVLITPLNNLLAGVHQATNDHRFATIPVAYDDEIGYLTRAFNTLMSEKQATIHQLRKADQAKSQFISMMSHELRTPLNAINGFAELLTLGLSGDLPETAQRDVQLIHHNGQQLTTLINDILDISQMEMGQIELHSMPIAVREIVQQIMMDVNPLAQAKALPLDYNIAADVSQVQADPTRLRQVLFNLLHNAVKFTDKGEIRLEVTRHSPEMICFSVIDTGIGIPKAVQSRIFEAFQQVDMSDARTYGGTGLGLSICRELVRLHGGEIWLESEAGQGTVVHFTMPLITMPLKISTTESIQ